MPSHPGKEDGWDSPRREKMKETKVYAISLGCPKNRVDAEAMLGSIPGGMRAVDAPHEADLVLINTCSFIRPAVEESLDAILEMIETLRDLSPRPLLAVTGCLPGRYGEDLKKDLPEVDFWGVPSELSLWSRRIGQALHREEQARSGRPGRAVSTAPGFAYMKISDGCDHACNYCTIPSIRGPLKSESVDGLVAEAEAVLATGRKELVLTAQDLTAYGRDLKDGTNLLRLVEKLAALPGLKWLRLMYLYPSGLTPSFLSALRDVGPPLLPYFDIPFQHVHPDVLKAMGRPKSADAETVTARVREAFPGAAIRTTFIVGHPGETEARFQALYDFVARAKLDHVGVFPYYPEDGTPSAAVKSRVSMKEKLRRQEAIMGLQQTISAKKLAARVGEELDVLVDAPHPEWDGLYLGRTWFQAPEADGVTYVSGPGVFPGKLVKASVIEARDYDLTALV